MNDLSIRTNNVPRYLIHGADLTDREREQYDFLELDLDDAVFFRYRGHAYYLGDFVQSPTILDWDAASADSLTTGAVVRLVGDDQVVVGSYRVIAESERHAND